MIHILTQHIEERYLFIVDIKVREITDNDKNLSILNIPNLLLFTYLTTRRVKEECCLTRIFSTLR